MFVPINLPSEPNFEVIQKEQGLDGILVINQGEENMFVGVIDKTASNSWKTAGSIALQLGIKATAIMLGGNSAGAPLVVNSGGAVSGEAVNCKSKYIEASVYKDGQQITNFKYASCEGKQPPTVKEVL